MPIIITDEDYKLLFSNSAFKRFSKEVNIEEEPFITFIKANLRPHMHKLTKPFEIPGKRIFLHAEIIDGQVVIHLEFVRQSLLNSMRREIINQFSASLSHIFYNLITIIKNNLEKEKENYNNRTINESVDRIQDIVDTVNLYSTNMSGYIHTEVFSLNKILDEAIKRNQPIWDFQAKLKKIDFKVIKEYKKEYFIKGSSKDMLLAIIHVIKNSLEAMPKGGELVIKTFEVKKGFVEIEVSDTGNGIDWQGKERVFEPFFTTKKLKRKGLGLSYSYGIVRKHRGSIRFKSQEAVGSEVLISIPFEQNVQVEAEEAPKHKVPKNILLIDDERIIVQTTGKILKKLSNANIYEANSGNKAIAIFRQEFENIDLIISDLGMDEVSGFDVAKFVLKFSEENNIDPPRFILYTGWGNHVTDAELKEFGIEAVYNKPLAPKDFKRILNL